MATTTTTRYCYDAFGRRIAKSSSVKQSSKLGLKGNVPRFGFVSYEKPQRQTMLMLWDGNRQVQEYTTDHVFTTVYEQDSFVPVGRVVWLQPHLQEQAKIAEDKQWQERKNYVIPKRQKERLEHQTQVGIRIYHYHNDHLGTPQELTNALGEVVWLNYSQAWGGSYETKCFAKELDNLGVSADLLQPIRFQGQFFDGETNLHYNRFRYYDSDVGMFVSRDPIGLVGGDNVFAYALNPTAWIDPFGLKSWKKGTKKPKGWRLPKNGCWSGEKGHSTFFPNNPQDLGLEVGEGINYKGGIPDFSPWAVTPWLKNGQGAKGFRVSGMTGDDRSLMVSALASKMGWTVTRTNAYLKANQYSLHHATTNTAQIIPTKLHDGIRHTGPASKLREKNNCIF